MLKKRSSVLNYEALISPIVEKDEPLFSADTADNTSGNASPNINTDRSHNKDLHELSQAGPENTGSHSQLDVSNNMSFSSLHSINDKKTNNPTFSFSDQIADNTSQPDYDFRSSFTFGSGPSLNLQDHSHENNNEHNHSHDSREEHMNEHEHNHSHDSREEHINEHDHSHDHHDEHDHSHDHHDEHNHSHDQHGEHNHSHDHENCQYHNESHYESQNPLRNVLYYFFPFMKGDDTPKAITSSFRSSSISQSIIQLYTSPETKRIFQFLMLNFTFMFVQMLYSFRSKSLGLFSDSLHMLLDCSSLAIGLFAKLASKRVRSSFYPTISASKSTAVDTNLISKYPFGLARVETLAAFVNGILLLSIVQDIFFESVHRLMNPVQLRNINELLVVSILGLIVNLVGIFAFNHGHEDDEGHSHGHSHGHSNGQSCSHESSHSDQHHDADCSHAPFIQPLNNINNDDSNIDSSSKPTKSHSSSSDNDHGIFLHILADTLGSAGVIVSTLLLKFFPSFKILDPISSLFIIFLILISCIPLLRSSFVNLLLVLPDSSSSKLKTKYSNYNDHESLVRDLLNDLYEVEGIVDVTNVKIWKDEVASSGGCSGHSHGHSHAGMGSNDEEDDGKTHLIGFIHLTYADGENSTILKKRCEKIINDSYGIDLFIQLDNDSWKL